MDYYVSSSLLGPQARPFTRAGLYDMGWVVEGENEDVIDSGRVVYEGALPDALG